jgi:hypothetical protein
MSEEKKQFKSLTEQVQEHKREVLRAKSKTTPATVLYSVLFKWHTGKANVKRQISRVKYWFPFRAFREINQKASGDAYIEFMMSGEKAKALVSSMEKAGIGVAKDLNFYTSSSKMNKLPYKENPPEMVQAPYDAVKLVDELEQKELDKQDI